MPHFPIFPTGNFGKRAVRPVPQEPDREQRRAELRARLEPILEQHILAPGFRRFAEPISAFGRPEREERRSGEDRRTESTS